MLKKLGPYARPYSKWIAVGVLCSAAEAIFELLIPLVMADIVNIGIKTANQNYILQKGLLMMGMAVISLCFGLGAAASSSVAGQGFGAELRRAEYEHIQDFAFSNIEKFSTASLVTRLTNDVNNIQMTLMMGMRLLVRAPVMLVAALVLSIRLSRDLSNVFLVVIPLLLIVIVLILTKAGPLFRSLQERTDALNLVVQENLTGIRVVKSFVREDYEEEKFAKRNGDLKESSMRAFGMVVINMPVMMLVMNGVSLLIVWVGGHQIADSAMQVGDMMAFIQYTMQIIMAFLMICMISVMLPRAAVSAERVDEVLKSETKIHDPKEPKTLPKNGKGEVAFEHVSFHYPGAEEDVLHDISFTAEPGKTTAFIGSTGCGKSTLVNLIPRFYDVTDGKITIDGKDVRDVSQHELREKLGYVPQKAVLFSGDIASNILYGNPDGSEAEMIEAATIAQATEFIDQKKKKYKSPISQGGANVSGGQKQRLSIARAIAKHPDVYIFDDSFSALDYKTDATLRAELKEKTAESTVMIVAQRISTILHADQIIVLEDGQIVGKGTHKELLKNCEAYYQIASSQLSEKELEEDLKEVESYAKR